MLDFTLDLEQVNEEPLFDYQAYFESYLACYSFSSATLKSFAFHFKNNYRLNHMIRGYREMSLINTNYAETAFIVDVKALGYYEFVLSKGNK